MTQQRERLHIFFESFDSFAFHLDMGQPIYVAIDSREREFKEICVFLYLCAAQEEQETGNIFHLDLHIGTFNALWGPDKKNKKKVNFFHKKLVNYLSEVKGCKHILNAHIAIPQNLKRTHCYIPQEWEDEWENVAKNT